MSIEYYLPIRKEKHKWSDRYKVVERPVLPRLIFIRTTFEDRIEHVKVIYGLMGYLNEGGPYHPAVVPDNQLEAFRRMVEHGEELVEVTKQEIAPGDHVRVVSGPLKGIECELVRVSQKTCIAVRLGSLGTATMELPVTSLEKISDN